MKVVLAIDSFKGCLTSAEANRAAAEGVRSVCPDADIVQVPVSDGGEGFVEAFHAAIGGVMQEQTVCDPLMRPITAHYLLKGETAVIEMAQASGLTLLTEEERNPLVTTSYGTGQMVADAVRRGARHLIVGLGGSATSDAGIGMLRALTDVLGEGSTHSGAPWDDIKALHDVHITIACDVKNPLCGEQGAAYVFAPQKFGMRSGAREADRNELSEELQFLERRARKFAELSARHFGFDRSQDAGAGAAGGLGYAFMQYMDAECRPGTELLFQALGFSETVRDADFVITGEGAADRQTLMGKLPMGVLQHSGQTPVCLIAGSVSDSLELLAAGFAHVVCINEAWQEDALNKEVAMRNISRTVAALLNSNDTLPRS